MEKEPGKDLEPPKPGAVDDIRTVLLGTLASLDLVAPGVGVASSTLVNILWKSRYERRVGNYLELLVAELERLREMIEDFAMLQRDAAISVGIAGAEAAGRIHNEEHLRALVNGVAKVTVDGDWDTRSDYALVLTRLVGELSVTHLHILGSMRQRIESVQGDKQHALSLTKVAELFPEHDQAAARGIIADLMAKDLVANAKTWFAVTEPSPDGPTGLGTDLLAFIEPLDASTRDLR